MAIEHYLPQFLLRGFAARVAADQYHTYQFRLGAEPHLTNVRNVAGEHGFYGQVGTTEVEQILQDRENFYAPLVERLRLTGANPPDKPLIEAFVTHLYARCRHARDSITAVVASGIDACRTALTAPEYRGLVSEVLNAKIARNPEVQALLGAFPAEQREHFERLLTASIEQFVARGAVSTWAKQVFVHLDEQIDLSEMARAGQGSALVREPPADAVRKGLTELTWTVRRSTRESGYILGDVCLLSQFSDVPDYFALPGRGVGSITAIFLPIAHDSLLVGTSPEARPVDDESVNRASSEFSRAFFVSATTGPREEAYFAAIGKRADAVDDSMTDSLIRQILDNERSGDTSTEK